MATVFTTTYGGNTAIGLDVSSLASSSTWIVGQESDQVDNSSNQYLDAIVNVKDITGHASTANTVGQEIRIYCWGADISAATYNILGTLTGTTASRTLTATKTQALRLAGSASAIVTTAGLTYGIQPFSVCNVLGLLYLPKYWGLWVTHNFTGALAASQNSLFTYDGIKVTGT